MKNRYLREVTRTAIDRQVEKVLRGLGNPDPPLQLEDARTLLKIDKEFYSSSSGGILRETVSRLRVAGKQIIQRPSLLLDAILRAELKALYIPDRKIILLEQSVPSIKQRWSEAHEIVHSILEWHGVVSLGDDRLTLNLACHEQIEAEANYGAGRLLFMQGKFDAVALASKPSFGLVQSISRTFRNSLTSSLWRLVELLDCPAAGVVSQHPRYTDATFGRVDPCRYFVRSRLFATSFSKITEVTMFQVLQKACSYKKRGPIANEEIVLRDDDGHAHVFLLEMFFNGHEALSLLTHVRPHPMHISVSAS